MKFSIVTTTYNSEPTLRATLDSILTQTYGEVESVVVDGGSTDGTLAIIEEYEAKFGERMRSVSEPDKGMYDAMNKGIAMATGDVVGILNSDDRYTSATVLERVAKAMADGEVDAVYGDIHFVKTDDTTRQVRYYSSKHFRRWTMRLGFMPAHPSFYCRREVYERYGTFDISYPIAADFENLLRLLFVHRIRTRYLPMDFVTMCHGGASTAGIHSHKQILKDHLRAYKQNGIYSNVLLESLRYMFRLLEKVWQLRGNHRGHRVTRSS
jgi:glycosyltransferase involved in cell wall biosynthesis